MKLPDVLRRPSGSVRCAPRYGELCPSVYAVSLAFIGHAYGSIYGDICGTMGYVNAYVQGYLLRKYVLGELLYPSGSVNGSGKLAQRYQSIGLNDGQSMS